MYLVTFSKKAEADKKLLKQANLEKKAKSMLNILVEDPFQSPPPYEKLIGNLSGYYSRRINIQHRLVYSVEPANQDSQFDGIVFVRRMWSHYE